MKVRKMGIVSLRCIIPFGINAKVDVERQIIEFKE